MRSRGVRAVFRPSILWQGSIPVPARFMGMHCHRWPEGAPLSPAPTYQFDVASSVDYSGNGGIAWPNLNPSEGVFDWDAMDVWVDTHVSAGRSVSYTLYRTPEWAASDTSHSDAYGDVGGGSNPTSLDHVEDFVTALFERYNAVSPANPTGRRGISYFKIWDEPRFSGSYSYSWWGTDDQFAALMRRAVEAALAVDAGVTIQAPGLFDAADITTLLTADAGDTTSPADMVDVICVHPYSAHTGLDTWTTGQSIDTLTAGYRAAMLAGGLAADFPLSATGIGAHFQTNNPILTTYAEQPMAMWLTRLHLRLIVLGYQSVYWYSHDGACIGRPSTSERMSRTLDSLAQLSGRTLTKIETFRDETVVTTDVGAVVIQ